MARFVVLEHDHPEGTHWDFMLEMGLTLATWLLPRPPDSIKSMRAQVLPDHRLKYLDYEGPISGNRGSVTRWDAGTYQVQSKNDTEIVVGIVGKRLTGQVSLRRSPEAEEVWQFAFMPEA